MAVAVPSEAKHVEFVAAGASRFCLDLLESVIMSRRILTAIGVCNRARVEGTGESGSKSTDKRG